MRILAAIAVLSTMCGSALAQVDFASVFSGKENPHSLKLKELNADWKRLSIVSEGNKSGSVDMMNQIMLMAMASGMKGGKGDDPATIALGMQMLGGMFGGGGGSEAAYFTKGSAVVVGGQTFLIAYRLVKPQMNLMDIMKDSQSGKEPDMSKLSAQTKVTSDTEVRLSLIDLRTISTINDIRGFELTREVEEANKSNGLMDIMAGLPGTKAEPIAIDKSAPNTAPTSPKKKPITKKN